MLPTSEEEESLFSSGAWTVAGIDEVGRGAWAGPVSVGVAVVTRSSLGALPDGVADSKLLTPAIRERLFAPLAKAVIGYAVGHASPAECDELGMTRAQRLATARAFEQLVVEVDAIIVDGKTDFTGRDHVRTIVGADRTCIAVAAASVLAKVTRDRMMVELAPRYQGYAFEQNKGYPSPAHRAGLSLLGLSELHRASWSFAPAFDATRGDPTEIASRSREVLLAILLALVAAAGNATATICQRLGVEQSVHEQGSALSLIRGVVHRPIWFLGFFVMTLAFGLQALALSVGTLSSVQPVMVTEIVFLVVIIGTWFRGQLTWREWLGSVGTAAALGAFLALSAPVGGTTQPSAESWLLLGVASGGAVVVTLLASRRGSRVWRAATFGIAAAICYALTAACVKSVADEWSNGVAQLPRHPGLYGAIVAGAIGLVLGQQALDAGPVAASQSVLLIVNPIVSIVMGTWLFGDHWQASIPRLGGAALALALMFVALSVLATSPLITSTGTGEVLSRSRPATAGGQ